MSYIHYNPNPSRKLVGDCVVRAISKATGVEWKTAYLLLAMEGYEMDDMPTSNSVWGSVLQKLGFSRYVIPNTCPNCYTVKDFCWDNYTGTYILATGTHVVAVKNGDYYDSWDSGDEIPIYYWWKEE